jgi:hypothetical protein
MVPLSKIITVTYKQFLPNWAWKSLTKCVISVRVFV